MTRDDVLKEYAYTKIDYDLMALEGEAYTAWHTDAMADEIVRWRTLDNERKARRAAREPIHSLYDILVQLSEENDDLIEERNRLRGALATVSGERDALVNLVEVLRQYYQMEATDDELYAAFCAWRENPFTGKASA